MGRKKKLTNRINKYFLYFVFTVLIIILLFFVLGRPFAKIVYPLKYKDEILKHAKSRDLDPSLVAAVIYVESRFNDTVESEAGARGLMQIRVSTGDELSKKLKIKDYNEDRLFEPETNINLGTFYLHDLLFRKYGRDLSLTLAAYHAGIGYVDKQIKLGKEIEIKETEDYVQNVKETERVYSALYLERLDREKEKISTWEMWKMSIGKLIGLI